MTAPTVQLFVNPRRSRAARRRLGALQAAFRTMGAAVIVDESVSGQLEVDPRADHACSVGGDGTLRHVVDAVGRAGRPIRVSTYPAGTINLLARERRYPRVPRAFARRVLGRQAPTRHYAALVGSTPMLSCASVGPDSFAVAGLSPELKARIGRAAYLWSFCKMLVRWPRVQLTLRCDRGVHECEAVYVAKGRYFAGRWSFAPRATTLHPMLHVVTLQRATRTHFLCFALRLVLGLPIETLGNVRSFQCSALTLSSAADAPLQADGDIVSQLPARISISPVTLDFA